MELSPVPRFGAHAPHWVSMILRTVRRKPLGAIAAAIVLVIGLLALFAPLVATYPVGHQDLATRFADPSRSHLFGADNLGRDIFTRIVFGARLSLSIAFSAALINLVVSTLIGVSSAYIGGTFDTIIQRFVDVWIALPSLLFLIFVVSILGSGVTILIILIGLLGAAHSSRVIRSAVIPIRGRPYIEAAKATGATDARIVARHVLPNVFPILIVISSINIGGFIAAEAALSFLGFGVPPPEPSWGRMLNASRDYLFEPWLAFWPGLFITMTVFGFQITGDALRDILDPRMRQAR